ncbi:MAG: hypothetical protein FWD98_04830 [Defluviitaleaceae bacterium]|nr:hypothetical protein [Defluviitaleaceae bacterium]
MSIAGVNSNNAAQVQQAPSTQSQNQTNGQAQNQTSESSSPAAVYRPSNQQPQASGNNRFVPDRAEMTRLTNEASMRAQQLSQLVERMFGTQSRTFETAMSDLRAALENGFEVPQDVVEQAQRDIADDGYFGVEQTSQRILDFARAISGGDPARINVLRDAVQRGFESAERAWGGQLPEISQRTLEAVMQGFDEWENAARSLA